MAEAIYYSIFTLIVLALAIGSWVAVAGASAFATHRGRGFLHWMFVPMLASLAVGVLVSNRSLAGLDASALLEVRHPLAVWLGRLTSIFVLLASAERIFSCVVRRRMPPGSWRLWLIVGFVGYWVTNIALPAAFGTKPDLSHEYLYALIIAVGVLLLDEGESQRAVALARNALILFVLASLLMIPIRPDLVLDRHYFGGLIPGLSLRFVGLATNANMMGPLAVSMLLCVWARPMHLKWLNTAAWAVGLVALVLCQSKTSWGAFVVCAFAMLVVRQGSALRTAFAQQRSAPLLMASIVVVMGVVTVLAGLLMFGGGFDQLSRFAQSRLGGDLLSFTGRFQIWRVALEEWARNPLFGYGPTLWSDEYRMLIGMPFSYHAHNQMMNVLATAGSIGAAGFLLYVGTLVLAGIQTARSSGGLSLALLLLLLLRGVTEAPMTIIGYGPEQLIQFLLLAVLAGSMRQPASASTVQATAGLHRVWRPH